MTLRIGRCLAVVMITAVVAHAQSHNVTKEEEVKSADPWTQAPAEFRGVKFGATLDEAQAVLGPLKCEEATWEGYPKNATRCHTKDRSKAFKVAGEVINTYYVFHEGTFVAVDFAQGLMAGMAQYAPPTYHELSTAFEQKYGTPTFKRTFRHTGVEKKTLRSYVGGRYAGSRPEFVPFDYKTYVVAWENETMHIYLASDQSWRLTNGSIETAAWRTAREEAQKTRKTDVTPF